MSSNEQEQVRSLARRIAKRIADDANPAMQSRRDAFDSDTSEASELQAELAKLKRRLSQLETQVGGKINGVQDRQGRDSSPSRNAERQGEEKGNGGIDRTLARAPWLLGGGGTFFSAVEPSEQRFGIGEAVTELVDYFEAGKTCEMESGEKPCDHCAMCSARGF